ncbi:Late transcription factor VLTF4 [Orf virus]|uniref:Late transcription factor VLTF4 n=1 Tax=Orf virus TaxID=10258 RepID=A0A0R8HYZ7_ORFV|nr:Late transcription factor VLTF4 [Orf virus]AYM26002.1 late transcription factor VLTF4 [Orf virus]
MSSWRLKMSKCSGSGSVQTLEDLRNRLRSEALGNECQEPRDDLFPNGEECLDIDGPCPPCDEAEQDIDQEQLPVPETVPELPAKTPKRRSVKKDKADKPDKSTKGAKKLCPPDDKDDELESNDVDNNEESGDAEGGASARSPSDIDNVDEMDDSDLMVAFSAILADFKDLTHRVKALSSVLTDVQATGIRRCFSTLGKALTEAAHIANTGAKPAAAPRKKKAATCKK